MALTIKSIIEDKNGSYRNLSLDDLRSVVYQINPSRCEHLCRVEAEMQELALRHVPQLVEPACRAAILHDITKHLDVGEHLKICRTYGEKCEVPTMKLYHSLTGSLIAKHVFGEKRPVYSAIFHHTIPWKYVSDLDMLDMLLILADNIERGRSFIGVTYLRDLAYRDPEEAVLCYLKLRVDIISNNMILKGSSNGDKIFADLSAQLAETLSAIETAGREDV